MFITVHDKEYEMDDTILGYIDALEQVMVYATKLLITGKYTLIYVTGCMRSFNYQVASRSTNPAVLSYVIPTADINMLHTIAHNKHITQDMMRQLSIRAEWQVRAGIATRKDTPTDILEKLKHDEDSLVRWYAS